MVMRQEPDADVRDFMSRMKTRHTCFDVSTPLRLDVDPHTFNFYIHWRFPLVGGFHKNTTGR
jgi:hypothetical protein